jgi:hypothetical protein
MDTACMKKKQSVQYTIRQVPEEVDAKLRELAVKEECSLNTVVLDSLSNAVGAQDKLPLFHDLDALAIQHDLILCSNDRHFDLLPQVARAG